MAVGTAEIYQTKIGIFWSFYFFFQEFFAILMTFWRISAKTNELLAVRLPLQSATPPH
jgi:hypothetical protein